MPDITYIVPPFREFVEKQLSGFDPRFDLNMTHPGWWSLDSPVLEIKTQDRKMAAEVDERSVVIYSRSLELKLVELAKQFEEKYSQNGQKIVIGIECLYRKDEGEYK